MFQRVTVKPVTRTWNGKSSRSGKVSAFQPNQSVFLNYFVHSGVTVSVMIIVYLCSC